MEKIKLYPSIPRLEDAVIEEKLDGTNIAIVVEKDKKVKIFSRKYEITYTIEPKYKEIVNWIESVDWNWLFSEHEKEPTKITIYGELIANGLIKYGIERLPVEKRFFIFDYKATYRDAHSCYDRNCSHLLFHHWHTHDVWASRERIQELFWCNHRCFQLVPLTTFNNLASQLNPKVKREGIILKFWKNTQQTKIKVVERNLTTRKQKVKVESL